MKPRLPATDAPVCGTIIGAVTPDSCELYTNDPAAVSAVATLSRGEVLWPFSSTMVR
jgi:hypothetical protein